MYEIILDITKFELLSKVTDALSRIKIVKQNDNEVVFQVSYDDMEDLQDDISLDIADYGMDSRQEWLNDYGKKLTSLYDEIFYQTCEKKKSIKL